MIESKLSKSQYLRGLQCHKKLWLYRNRKDLLEEPDAAQQALFDTGTAVGLLAQQLFPGGEEIRFEEGNFDDKIQRTKDLIESGVRTIYEATFKYKSKSIKGSGLYLTTCLKTILNKWSR
ncbi:MAG: hypothetical protein G3M70_11070 [Candidatus Nitronauta litoralis]|uniref:Uncharacterized protein n=1 Tax=Candidatus Nitronauta litoralis TaxID=2705533 RepID=A0A7T0BWU4_9BACT|nr:MAG: hypothetical protein G3M70_11070 [Candidatus Nitronauta litoralis]